MTACWVEEVAAVYDLAARSLLMAPPAALQYLPVLVSSLILMWQLPCMTAR